MLRLSLRMTLARKGRLVLTSLAIILGTGFLSGTLIFSDTLNKTFDRLFADVFRDVDAYVRSSQFVEVGARGFHELDGAVDLGRQALVALVRGVLREALVPAVHLTQVGEPTLEVGQAARLEPVRQQRAFTAKFA